MENLRSVGDRPRVTRAVILARGAGTRMQRPDDGAALSEAQRAAAGAGHKALMPIGGRPFLDHVIAPMATAGVSDIAVVVGPDHGAMRAAYPDRVGPGGVRLTFVVQERALGTANAVLAAEAWSRTPAAEIVHGGAMFVCNGDNVYPRAAFDALRDLSSDVCGVAGFDRDALVEQSNIPAERIAAFAVIERSADAALARIIEKPTAADLAGLAPPMLVGMNLWRFDARIFDACRDTPLSPRGEFELPAAVMLALARGMRVRVATVRGGVLDLSSRADIADVERRLANGPSTGARAAERSA